MENILNRRTFLKWVGVGAATVVVNPVELLEGLDKSTSVTSEPVDIGYESVMGTPNGTMYLVKDGNRVLRSTDIGATWFDENGTKVYKKT